MKYKSGYQIIESSEMEDKRLCNVNVKLIPIKSHFFFFYGAMGGVIPFMPVLGKSLGINATAVGLVYTVLPFCVFFSKPLFGYITDYFRNIKLIVLCLATVTAAAYVSVLLIPSLSHWSPGVQLDCRGDWMALTVNDSTFSHSWQGEQQCTLSLTPCNGTQLQELSGTTTPLNSTNHVFKFKPVTNFTCDCIADNSSSFIECSDDPSSVYKTFQFWIFTMLLVIGGTGSATVFCLSDAACYEVLGDQPQHYGRQRLWATISWGVVTFLAGFLNDLATAGDPVSKTYAPGFYLMLGLVFVDLLLLFKIQLTKANFSISICKDIGEIFSSFDKVVFALAVYIVGALTGLIWNYQFWFLQDLGASQTLMGLMVAVQCLAAEVPFFFFAGWFIRKFGHFFCLTGAFAAFALRLGLYYVIKDPWMMLPVELLHGITFAVFYASMTGYASDHAPSGTEATMMGILGGLYEGLGVATGSLLGGVGFDKLGGRGTFLVASIISLVCTPVFALTYIITKRLRQG